MRTSALAAAAMVAVLAVPSDAAIGRPGPFAGAVAQGETDTHLFDNNPTNDPCIHLMTTYSVTLSYAPAVDTLTLSVGGRSVPGRAGLASTVVSGSWCTSFSIGVTGTTVTGPAAAYTLTVTRDLAGGGSVTKH